MAMALHDIRVAVRHLGRRPVFTAAAVASLALGIAATTTVSGLLYAALLRRPPFPDADRLVMVYRTATPENRAPSLQRWSWPRIGMLKREAAAMFDAIGDYGPSDVNLGGDGRDPEQVRGEVVSSAYFAILGAAASEGRVFTASEDSVPERDAVVVLGRSLWLRRYGGDPATVGREVTINGVRMTVIGIMQPGFAGLTGGSELWIPDMIAPAVTYAERLTTDQNFISVIARVAPGLSIEDVRARIDRVGERIARALPDDDETPTRWGATVVPIAEARIDPANRRSLGLLFAAVSFLLLLTCANVGGLGVSHAVTRRREMAVRLALGAGRRDLARQLMTESALLGAGGGTIGLILAVVGLRIIRPPDSMAGPLNMYGALAEFASAKPDAFVPGFALVVCTLAIVLSGIVPALHVRRTDLATELRDRTGTEAHRAGMRAASMLVIIEVALALVLAIASVLLFGSLRRLEIRPTGFRPDHLLTFGIQPPPVQYDTDRAPEVIDRVLAAIETVPGVESATVDACAPLGTRCASNTLFIAGRPSPPPGQDPFITRHYVGPDHFATLGIPLLRGRAFSPDDRAGRPGVTIINETAARRFWPGEDPIGRRVWFAGSGFTSPDSSVEIIGIVGDVQYGSVERGMPPSFYTPYRQFTYAARLVIVRTRNDPYSLVPAIRAAVRTVDDLPIHDVRSMEARIGATWTRSRFNARVMGAFAVLAIVLAAAGIHGIMAHSVSQRTREMGIRMAIGATPASVLRLVVGHGLLLAAIGVTAGAIAALVMTRFMRALLFEVGTLDPAAWATGVAVLLGAALLASWLPARRAVRVNPVESLRGD